LSCAFLAHHELESEFVFVIVVIIVIITVIVIIIILTCCAVTGRRSLLMHLPSSPDDCFCLVSAAPAALVTKLDSKTWSAIPSGGSQAADQSGVEKGKNSMQPSTLQVCLWKATAKADAQYQGHSLYVQTLAHADVLDCMNAALQRLTCVSGEQSTLQLMCMI